MMDDDPRPTGEEPLPSSDTQRFTLLKTTYVWIALLVAITLAPRLIARDGPRPPARPSGGITSAVFSRLVSAESQTRLAFGQLGSLRGGGGSARVERRRTEMLTEAVDEYREILDEIPVPGIPRRILILDAALGRRLDPRFLSEKLRPALQAAKTPPDQIERELALWRTLYGRKRIAANDLDTNERLIRSFRLPFLTNRVLHDLYAAANLPRQAAEHQRRLEKEAGRLQWLLILTTLSFLAGAVLLGIFVMNAWRRRWDKLARVATQPHRLRWGDMLDALFLYLLLVKGVGLVVGLAVAPILKTATPRLELILQASVYVSTGVIALTYLLARIRGRRLSLRDLGLTTRPGLWGHIAFGIAGYLATLPLVMAARLVSEALFKHLPDTTPNPIMPLILSERDPAARLLIFLLVAVAAPFFEELFFRGALFAGLRARWTWVPATAVSALLFAVVHPPQDWLPIFALGVGFGVMREMRQSLVPSMTAHLVQNASTFVFLSLLFRPS